MAAVETNAELLRTIEDALWNTFKDKLPTKEEVEKLVSGFVDVYVDTMGCVPELKDMKMREQFVKLICIRYHKQQSVKQQKGVCLVDDSSDDNTPWLQAREGDISWYYWRRYKKYLGTKLHWGNEVVQAIDRDSKDVLRLCGDPAAEEGYSKKGLVVGNVQSGKTANYTGLICRAADAGYRYILVLAATTNDLRAQTQQRIEEGFVGRDVSRMAGNQPVRVGVGELRDSAPRYPNPGTTRIDDFKKAKMKTLMQIQASNVAEPWVFVLKKNTSTLKNIVTWLKSNVAADSSLLLIDDEADNASINTKKSKEEISKINSQIRELLGLFAKSTYVGYTATPYANILIDKDEIDEEFHKDLFPRNFIYTLNAADSYFGADKVFGDIDPEEYQVIGKPKYIRFIDDIFLMPPSAKELKIGELPESLKRAIRTFVLASVIRVNRAGDTHTSMLINSSPYNAVQKKLQGLVDRYLDDVLKPQIRVYSSLSPDEAASNSAEIKELAEIWKDEFAGDSLSWESALKQMNGIVGRINTKLVNSKSKDGLDYNGGVQHVIAIGGYRLSRGLTLEGLLVSYYSRNSRAYDTLMQMSRWFGHRVGYEDICRVWMTEESAGWCRYVADATDELMGELVRMQQMHRTPLDFGLAVRSHPSALMVTARNKMGAGELRREVRLSGKTVETTALTRSQEAISHNMASAKSLMTSLEATDHVGAFWGNDEDELGGRGVLYHNVPTAQIRAFVQMFNNCPESLLTKTDPILTQIAYCEEDGMDKWDVMFAGATSASCESVLEFECSEFKLRYQRRQPGARTNEQTVYVGNRSKVSTKYIECVGMSKQERSDAEEKAQSDKRLGVRASFGKCCLDRRRTPLLVVHFLDMRFKNEKEYNKAVTDGDKRLGALESRYWHSFDYSEPNVAYSICFPRLNHDRAVDYVFNKTALESMSFGDDVADEDSDIEDEYGD
ncbi:Z1 domain-containing protein [Paratractidigestivibacter sp.]|uniref:Z1 domain-containing protein n=1 Tax=Paratractidigestivibacter sp. TaxID=2847316 RepID=UPI002AC992BF|nr:Z1 domain-containing protein [Paratractidigestivibacter sp.]